MRRLAHAVTEHPVRILVAWLVAIAAVVALTSPGSAVDRADVMKSDQADFLPGRYESVRAARLQHEAFPAPDGATSTVVIHRRDHAPLTSADVRRAGDLVAGLRANRAVRTIAAPSTGLAPNGKVLLGTVVFRRTAFDQMLTTDVDRLRDRTDAAFARSGLVAGYAGQAATQVDAGKREGITSMLTML